MIVKRITFSSWICNQAFLLSSPCSLLWNPDPFKCVFFFCPTDRPTDPLSQETGRWETKHFIGMAKYHWISRVWGPSYMRWASRINRAGPLHQTGLAHVLFPLKVLLCLYEEGGLVHLPWSWLEAARVSASPASLSSNNEPCQLQTVTGPAYLI